MISKRQLQLLLLLFLLLVTACAPSNDMRRIDIYTGTRGVELEFVGESPPDELYEGSEFPLAIFVSNDGTFTLDGAQYTGELSYSYDSFYLEEIVSDNPPDKNIILEGKSYFYPEGDFNLFSLPRFKAKPIEGQRENPKTDIFVSACYPYQTKLTDEICIDAASLYQDVRAQPCRSEDKTYNSQGAPVAITRVKAEMHSSSGLAKPSFIIEFSNRGSGSVLAPVEESDLTNACELQKEPEYKKNWNKVKISAKVSNTDLSCVPEEVNLRDNKGVTRCYLETSGFGGSVNYMTSLIVTLDYVYLTSISKTISITRASMALDISSSNCEQWELEINDVCVAKCDLCNENSHFGFCYTMFDVGSFGCDCTQSDCETIIQNKKGPDANNITVKNSNCLFGSGWCESPNFCCRKQ